MPPYDLPNQNTDEGALVRLLIIEVGNQPGDPAGVREAMGLMKRVLENRLKSPQDFEARGATTMTQIIQAHGKHGKAEQFLGFKAYPKLAPGQQGALDKDMDAAATPGRQNDPVRYLIATAFAVCSERSRALIFTRKTILPRKQMPTTVSSEMGRWPTRMEGRTHAHQVSPTTLMGR